MFNRLGQHYWAAKQNKYYRYFAMYCSYSLAIGFFISGQARKPIARQGAGKQSISFCFFAGVVATLVTFVISNQLMYGMRSGNEPAESWVGCKGGDYPKACETFFDCIHNKGLLLMQCLELYKKVKAHE
ncbi:MAG: hypothetical protein EOO03_13365 [Chitinophagaceae bacterium]|nr:MAG: hypothetical protein EOO03_13365 [Chitinophagaceae bacterium]